MSDHPEPGSGEVAHRVYRQARMSATSAVLRVARATGAHVISRPAWPGSNSIPDYAEPSSGLRIARALESAATGVTRDYVRYGREAGLTWHDIGVALGFRADPRDSGTNVGDAAFSFAADVRRRSRERPEALTFRWTCPACHQNINDHGPSAGSPSEQQQGHATDCYRMAAFIAAWNAEQ